MKRNYTLLLLTILFVTNKIFAQPGSLDYTFGQGGKVTTNISQLLNFGYKLLIQPDGKMIQIGFSAPSQFYGNFSIVRYDTNGSLDPTFGINGIVETLFGTDEDVALSGVLQPDGKIIAAGYSWNGITYDFAMVRYLPSGDRDISFGVNGIVTTDFSITHDSANQVLLQPDGKILLAGTSGDLSSIDLDMAFARYNSNGTLDNSFGTNGKTLVDIDGSKRWQSARAVTLQSDGKIVVTGFTDIPNPAKNSYTNIIIVTRLNSNGTSDNNFGILGTVKTAIGENAVGISIKLQSDGKLLVLAKTRTVKIGGYEDFLLLRYNSNGSLDNTFGTNGSVVTTFDTTDDLPSDLLIQPDGKILAIGTVAVNNGSTLDFAMARYNTDGSLDNTFGNGGKVKTDFAGSWDFGTSAVLQKDGKILIGGYSRVGNDYNFALARYNNDASLPVKLISFDAHLLEKSVKLNWETAFEINSDYFEIQHSLDGINWLKIGLVKSNNNTDSNSTYYFTDSNPSKGKNFYRLKLVDLDQTFTLTSIRQINVLSNTASDWVDIFPNPVSDQLNIKVKSGTLESIKLSDASGRIVYWSDKPINSIDLRNYIPGIYLLLLINEDGLQISKNIFLQK